jgi:hypothetical protein
MSAPVDDADFWHENTGYPALHYSISASFYFTLASLPWRTRPRLALLLAFLLAIIGFYFWETAEVALGFIFGVLQENKTDSLIGDPLIDFLGVLTLFLLDLAFLWQFPVTVPAGLVVLQFVLVGALSFVANDFVFVGVRFGLLIVWFVLVTSVVAVYLPFSSRRGQARALTLIIIVTAQALSGAFVALDAFFSTYLRALFIALFFAYLAVVVVIWSVSTEHGRMLLLVPSRSD